MITFLAGRSERARALLAPPSRLSLAEKKNLRPSTLDFASQSFIRSPSRNVQCEKKSKSRVDARRVFLTIRHVAASRGGGISLALDVISSVCATSLRRNASKGDRRSDLHRGDPSEGRYRLVTSRRLSEVSDFSKLKGSGQCHAKRSPGGE